MADVTSSANGVATGSSDGLPVGEFLQPAAVIALIITALNDHVLKTSGLLPAWLTGKLSDIAGLLFFPLFLTAGIDTALYLASETAALLGKTLSLPYRLTRAKLLSSCILSGILFSALKLIEPAKDLYIAAHGLIGLEVQVTQDATDLIALLALPLAYHLGRRFVIT